MSFYKQLQIILDYINHLGDYNKSILMDFLKNMDRSLSIFDTTSAFYNFRLLFESAVRIEANKKTMKLSDCIDEVSRFVIFDKDKFSNSLNGQFHNFISDDDIYLHYLISTFSKYLSEITKMKGIYNLYAYENGIDEEPYLNNAPLPKNKYEKLKIADFLEKVNEINFAINFDKDDFFNCYWNFVDRYNSIFNVSENIELFENATIEKETGIKIFDSEYELYCVLIIISNEVSEHLNEVFKLLKNCEIHKMICNWLSIENDESSINKIHKDIIYKTKLSPKLKFNLKESSFNLNIVEKTIAASSIHYSNETRSTSMNNLTFCLTLLNDKVSSSNGDLELIELNEKILKSDLSQSEIDYIIWIMSGESETPIKSIISNILNDRIGSISEYIINIKEQIDILDKKVSEWSEVLYAIDSLLYKSGFISINARNKIYNFVFSIKMKKKDVLRKIIRTYYSLHRKYDYFKKFNFEDFESAFKSNLKITTSYDNVPWEVLDLYFPIYFGFEKEVNLKLDQYRCNIGKDGENVLKVNFNNVYISYFGKIETDLVTYEKKFQLDKSIPFTRTFSNFLEETNGAKWDEQSFKMHKSKSKLKLMWKKYLVIVNDERFDLFIDLINSDSDDEVREKLIEFENNIFKWLCISVEEEDE